MMGRGAGSRMRPGGASAAAGIGFQEDVAAWLAVHVLVEGYGPPLPPLAANVRVVSVAGETPDVIDDIVATATDGTTLYVQAKRAVPQLVDREGSAFTSFVEQAVGQHLAVVAKTSAPEALYILATSSDASAAVRRELRIVLERLRDAQDATPLDDVGHTNAQKAALATSVQVVRRKWRDLDGDPTDQDIRALLKRVAVWDLDLEGSHRSAAITLLSAAVVRDSMQAGPAWMKLKHRAGATFINHETLDIVGWRRALLNEGIRLRDVPSFGPDIAKLRAHSVTESRDLSPHQLLRVGTERVQITRAVTEEAQGRLRDGPMLLVGEPGAGKTAVLAALAQQLAADGHDVVVLSPESTAARSLPELRTELRLDHPLFDVLEAWGGDGPAYLLIDGLDDTRGSPSVGALRRLVRQIARRRGRWVPVASVRRFDLRYSPELREIFAAGRAGPTGYHDQEFEDVRHVLVPDFEDEELDQLEEVAPALVRMARHPVAGPLLRRPVHLQLAADLLASGASETDIWTLRTQVELLDMYWRQTIESPATRRHGRERVLAVAAEAMMRERLMAVDRRELDRTDATGTLELLGAGVLVEGVTTLGAAAPVRFLHVIVADYAVSRLVLAGTGGGIDAVLAADRSNALFLRPAVELRYAALWAARADRLAFWREALAVAADRSIPEIGKLIGPTVAAGTWRSMGDVAPLIAALSTPQREAGIACLRHLIGAVTTPGSPPIAGSEAAPWDALVVQLAGVLTPDMAHVVRLLVTLLTEDPSALTVRQAGNVGTASRRLLEFAWESPVRDSWLVRWALRAVCRTFASDPLASRALVCHALRRHHVAAHGFEELTWLADELESLEADPDLLVALYTAAFRFDDSSGDATWLSSSPVLPMTSNRRQDFEMSRYVLAEGFASFLNANPPAATIALLRAHRGYVVRRRRWGRLRPIARFSVAGRPARIRADYSEDWMADHSASDDEVRMSRVWLRFVTDGGVAPGELLERVIDAFLSTNRLVFGWRLLIHAGIDSEALNQRVVHLIGTAPALLLVSSLHGDLCRLAAALRDRPEVDLSELRAVFDGAGLEPDARARLLGCLEPKSGAGARADEGPELEESPASLVAHREPVAGPVLTPTETAVTAWLDDSNAPAAQTPDTIAVYLRQIVEGLQIHDDTTESTWRLVSTAAARLASQHPDCADIPGGAAAHVLLRVVDVPADVVKHAPERYDEVETIWSHPCVLDAVKGLVVLYADGRCAEQVPSGALLSLADHPLPWARDWLARCAPLLVASDADLMWRLLSILAQDPSARVVSDTAAIASRVRSDNPAQARGVLDRVLVHDALNEVTDLGESALALAGQLAVDGLIPVDEFRSILLKHGLLARAGQLLQSLRRVLTADSEDPRQRSFAVVSVVEDIAVARYEELVRQLEVGTEGVRSELFAVVNVLGLLGTELYFASGAYHRDDEGTRISEDRMIRFFDEACPLLRTLLPVAPGPAIHHVVEIAAANTGRRPRESFLLIAEAVQAARRVGYETDGLARDLVLGAVQHYLSDRRELFHGSADEAQQMRDALVAILDSFVGWPQARGLAYHLHEVFR